MFYAADLHGRISTQSECLLYCVDQGYKLLAHGPGRGDGALTALVCTIGARPGRGAGPGNEERDAREGVKISRVF